MNNPSSAALALAGRILLSAIFLISAFGKIAAPAGTIGYIAAAGLAAVVLAVFCIAAALGFHANLGDQNQFAHFLKNLSMAGGLLGFAAFGAGAWSLDTRRLVRAP